VLTDTPGLRPERRVKDPVEYFGLRRAERSIRRAHVVVLILDALDGPREQDRKIAAQIRSHGKGCVMLVNKWDLAQGVTQREYEEALRRAAPFLDHVPVLFISALNGLNVRKTVDVVDRVASQIQTRLPTGLLNRVILAAHERIQPPMIGGKRLKIFYAVQTGVEPLRINLFVNDPKRLTPAYGAYLVKALRETFGLEGIPVVFSTKARRGKPQRMDGG
jgi:GTP-binding protein